MAEPWLLVSWSGHIFVTKSTLLGDSCETTAGQQDKATNASCGKHSAVQVRAAMTLTGRQPRTQPVASVQLQSGSLTLTCEKRKVQHDCTSLSAYEHRTIGIQRSTLPAATEPACRAAATVVHLPDSTKHRWCSQRISTRNQLSQKKEKDRSRAITSHELLLTAYQNQVATVEILQQHFHKAHRNDRMSSKPTCNTYSGHPTA